MVKTILHITDMACGMCESHINSAIRNKFQIKKISSSHTRNRTEILSDQPLDEEEVRKVINGTGYTLVGIESAPYEKKGLFRKK